MMTPRSVTQPGWLNRFEADTNFRNLFYSYLRTECYFVRGEGWSEWRRVFRADSDESPVHYEFLFGQWEGRMAYNRENLNKARHEKRTVLSKRMGFHDVFVPVMDHGKVWGVLVAGALYQRVPRYEDLAQQWREISGTAPGAYHPGFTRFARLCLRRPTLEGPAFESFVTVLELFARWLTARGGETVIVRRLEKLQDGIFSKMLPHEFWMSWALGENPSAPTPWFGRREVGTWERHEIGIDRIPNTVLAVATEENAGTHDDPVRALLQGRDLHMACHRLAQGMPHAAGGRFLDSMAAFLTAPRRGASVSQARLEMRDLARRIQEHLLNQCGRPVRIGVGRAVPTGESLRPSAQEALAALQMALHTRKPLVFYGDPGVRSEEVSFSQVQSLARALENAAEQRETAAFIQGRDRYVRAALLHFGENREAIRTHVLSVLLNVVEVVGRRIPAGREALDRLRAFWEERLAQAGSTVALWEGFREGCDALSALASKPAEGARHLRLERALEDVRGNFSEALSAAQVARRWGFSPSDFSRMVRRATGRSFPAYRESLRVEHAKRLLLSSTLPASQVAVECGFRTAAYFGRIFKRAVGMTPDQYRRA